MMLYFDKYFQVIFWFCFRIISLIDNSKNWNNSIRICFHQNLGLIWLHQYCDGLCFRIHNCIKIQLPCCFAKFSINADVSITFQIGIESMTYLMASQTKIVDYNFVWGVAISASRSKSLTRKSSCHMKRAPHSASRIRFSRPLHLCSDAIYNEKKIKLSTCIHIMDRRCIWLGFLCCSCWCCCWWWYLFRSCYVIIKSCCHPLFHMICFSHMLIIIIIAC